MLTPIKDCCQNQTTRVEVRTDRVDATVHQCLMCGRKHYRLKIEPGQLGATFQPASGQ